MSKTFSLPHSSNIHRVQLSNGIVVLAVENPHVQSVVVYGTLKAGGLHDPSDKIGLASLTASALMTGTTHRDFDTLHSTLEDIGADLGFGAGVNNLSFSGKSLAEDVPTVLELLADALRNPTFPTEQIDLLRNQRLTELKYAQQDTRYRAGRAFRENLYPVGHPYHVSTYGTMESLATLTPADLQAFHERYYGTHGMIITLVGAIKPEQAVAEVQRHLADWANPQQPDPRSLPTITAPESIQRIVTPIDGKTQSDIVLGTVGPTRYDSDYMAASLANSILGEFGMMGRIGGIIREELGLAYYASSSLEGGEGQGAWSVSAGVAHQNIDLAIDKIMAEIQRITHEPVSDADLADNQSYYTGRLPLRLESSGGIATTIESIERFGLGLDYLVNYRDMIYSITKEDILAVTRKYLDPERFVVSVAGVNGDG